MSKKMPVLAAMVIALSFVLSSCFVVLPDKPTNLTVAAGYKSAVLQWQDNASNEDSYEIYHSTDGSNFYPLTSLGPNTTYFTHDNISHTYYHYYKVGAKNQFGISWSDVKSTKPVGPATIQGKVSPYMGSSAFISETDPRGPVLSVQNVGRSYVPGEILVRFMNGSGKDEILKDTVDFRFSEKDSFASKDGVFSFSVLKVEGISVEEAVEIFSDLPYVEYAEPNYIAREHAVPDDTYYPWQHSMPQIRMPQAWNIEQGNNVIYVAVIDTGVDYNHPELNTVVNSSYDYDFVDNDTAAFDERGHGTHVAGIIAAETNNSQGIAGVNWGGSYSTKILPIRVLDENGNGSYSNIAKAVVYATEHSAKVINMSLGGYSPSTTLYNALKYSYANGVLIVASAGNDNRSYLEYPAAYTDYVISVGAVNRNSYKTYYSNYSGALQLELVAPGGEMNYSGDPDGIYSTFYATPTNSHTYKYLQGTSMAAPHVSGLIALLLSNGVTGQSLVRSVLRATAVDLGSGGKDAYYGYGMIDAYSALTYTSSWEPLIVWTAGVNGGTPTYAANDGNYSVETPPGNVRVYAWQDFDHSNSYTEGDFYGFYGYTGGTTSITTLSVQAGAVYYGKNFYVSSIVDDTLKPVITSELIDLKKRAITEHYRELKEKTGTPEL